MKATIGGEDTYFVGNIYEKTGGAETKYYYAGGQRIAMRVSGTLYYLLTDHLGSTTVTTGANGAKVAEVRYAPWGEVRYTSGTTPTDYTFTGQYSNVDDFGLMYYNARWYDPELGRFAQADSVVPPGAQGWDRYAYANNNPVNYADPSGHRIDDGCRTEGCDPTEGGVLEWRERRRDERAARQRSGFTLDTGTALGIVLDLAAFAANGVYALTGDAIGVVCPECYPGVLVGYQYYSVVPNGISTWATMTWIIEGVITGENSLSISAGPQGTRVSFSISQDTVISTATNVAGWTVLRDPNLGTGVDAAQVVYDYGRAGILGKDLTIPAVNPTITFDAGAGFGFSWWR